MALCRAPKLTMGSASMDLQSSPMASAAPRMSQRFSIQSCQFACTQGVAKGDAFFGRRPWSLHCVLTLRFLRLGHRLRGHLVSFSRRRSPTHDSIWLPYARLPVCVIPIYVVMQGIIPVAGFEGKCGLDDGELKYSFRAPAYDGTG